MLKWLELHYQLVVVVLNCPRHASGVDVECVAMDVIAAVLLFENIMFKFLKYISHHFNGIFFNHSAMA